MSTRPKALQNSTWKSICFQLWQQSISAVVAERPKNILFHCFGGIKRSAAVLCAAWLIVAYGYSVEEAFSI
jgi:protein-tyrosine phosphatase